ncbi:hypothetical protein PMAYCL1PPCAC_06612 [Pristionchus mayeri]|uniref:Uncharacterized protein n=1 Tax=Pristionchus mayeri TaxID=1317129 RepID=A0AAN4ZES2_9BILA|nr:hypothetical protein PMAYCL1PPCAC_06612 [Pristionchus mayeri]
MRYGFASYYSFLECSLWMQSHLRIGRIILAVSICAFNAECSVCKPVGWTPSDRDGYCLNQNKLQNKEQVSKVLDSHHCENITENENYHPCIFSSSQSCAVVFTNFGWISGCIPDDHGVFIEYSMNSSKHLMEPVKATYRQTFSVGSFCKSRSEEPKCANTTVLSKASYLPATVCCCKTSACTDGLLRLWGEDKMHSLSSKSMVTMGIVGTLGIVQAVMLSTALIALFHDYYSRYKVRVVIGEAEKAK